MSIEPETMSDAQADAEIEAGDNLFDLVMSELSEGEEDPMGVAYSLWLNLTAFLADMGMEPQDLAKDAICQAVAQTCEGMMQ